jgi:polyisoprenoid-binding protein YceI
MKYAISMLCAATALVAVPARAQQVVPDKSEVGFVIKQMGVPVEGRFTKFDAQVSFDPKKPDAGKIGFTIALGSADIGDAETKKEVAKPEWFNTAKFPSATFQSGAIKSLGAGKFEVAGKLSIKGNTRDVVVPVTVAQAAGTSTATGQFTLKRVEFKVGEGDWSDTSIVANEVQVKFKLALTGMAAL